MPTERLSMRQIREVLRLRFASKLSQRAIAKSLRLSQGAVSGYLSRARAAGAVWPLPDDLDDPQLEARLFPPAPAIAVDQRSVPDWAWVHRELPGEMSASKRCSDGGWRPERSDHELSSRLLERATVEAGSRVRRSRR
jgi:hypothetical protein